MFSRNKRPAIRLEEIHTLPLAGQSLPYRLKRSSARRTLAMRVSAGGEIAVNAPLKLAQADIDQFLSRHAGWLQQCLSAIKPADVQWRSGAALPWQGGSLELLVQEAAGRASVYQQDSVLHCASSEVEKEAQIEATIRHWYQRQARTLLTERLAHHAARAGLAMPAMRLSDARTRWGSLSAKGVVSLNWRLIKASREELDYVVCHELAHFRQRNHSAAFWREVAVLYPDYAAPRALLKRNGQRYFEW